jgi:ubiquinone/menaquinone biosynthesis C-methylase UbiE
MKSKTLSAVEGWLALERTPEPEVMGDAEEVEAYASAATQAYLDAVDDSLVEQVLCFGPLKGWLLDLGTGPGCISLKIARRSPELRVVGVDRSWPMIQAASRAAAREKLDGRAFFMLMDAAQLGFRKAFFDVVLSNSLLHHLPEPVAVFNEMARVSKPEGLVLLRDLRRPSRLAFPFHVRWHGRHYTGTMRKLYQDSVRAAYTEEELAGLLGSSALAGAQTFEHRRTHLGFYRARAAERGPDSRDLSRPDREGGNPSP